MLAGACRLPIGTESKKTARPFAAWEEKASQGQEGPGVDFVSTPEVTESTETDTPGGGIFSV